MSRASATALLRSPLVLARIMLVIAVLLLCKLFATLIGLPAMLRERRLLARWGDVVRPLPQPVRPFPAS